MLAQSEKDITFDWNVPYGTRGGDYEIAFYFTSANRFNLLGLSFTDDVTGNKASFHITDDINTPVTFNKDTVKLNTTPFYFAAFPPHFTKDEPVTIYTEVTNPSDEERTVDHLAVGWYPCLQRSKGGDRISHSKTKRDKDYFIHTASSQYLSDLHTDCPHRW